MPRPTRRARGRLAALDRGRDLAPEARERELAAQVKMAWFDAQAPSVRAGLRHSRIERTIPPAFVVDTLMRLGALDPSGGFRLPELPHIE